MGPVISAIMPVYNAAGFVREAVESVLEQTLNDFELIIVDDGSTDGSTEILQEYSNREPRIKLILNNANRGTAYACNRGLIAASGGYVCFTAADDIQFPERFAETVDYLNQNTDLDMVFFNYELIDECGRKLGRNLDFPRYLNNRNVLMHQLRRNYMWSGLVTLKRTPDIVFDEELPCSVDYDLFLKLLIKGYRFGYIDKPLMYYRTHSQNISGDATRSRLACQRILRKLDFDEILPKLLIENDELDAAITVAMVKMLLDEWDQAATVLKRAEALPGARGSYELFFYEGVSNYKLKNFEKSSAYFRQALALESNEPTSLNNLAVLEHLFGNRDKSEALLKKALLKHSQYKDAMMNLDKVINDSGPLILTERILRKQLVHGTNYRVKI